MMSIGKSLKFLIKFSLQSIFLIDLPAALTVPIKHDKRIAYLNNPLRNQYQYPI
jgi:hypothetical protein